MRESGSSQKWWLVIVLGIATSVAYMDRVILSVATPTMMKMFRMNAAQAGLLLSAFFWSYSFMQIPSGWLLDRFGSRKILSIGYTLWSLSSAMTGMVSSYGALLVCRIGLGIGEGPTYPAGYRIANTWFPEESRGLASAIYSEGAKLGPAIGAPIAALLLSAYGWRTLFWITGLGSLLWLIPWLLVAPKNEQAEIDKLRSQTRMSWKLLLKHQETWGIALGYFGYLYVIYVYITWLPGYLILSQHCTILAAGWITSISFLIQSLSGLFGGWMADRLIHQGHSATVVRKSFIGGGLLLGISLVPAALVKSDELAVMLFAVSLAGLGIAVSNMLAVPAGLAPKGQGGTVGGIQNMAGNLGGTMAPAVTGCIYAATHSFVIAILVSGVMLVVSAVGYLILVRRIEPMEVLVPVVREEVTV